MDAEGCLSWSDKKADVSKSYLENPNNWAIYQVSDDGYFESNTIGEVNVEEGDFARYDDEMSKSELILPSPNRERYKIVIKFNNGQELVLEGESILVVCSFSCSYSNYSRMNTEEYIIMQFHIIYTDENKFKLVRIETNANNDD